MSRSNPNLTNPAQHFFKWEGSKGQLTWWDKENKKNVPVRLPFTFLVLDELSTITGYNKQLESGYWSNEVRATGKDELFVRTSKGPFEAGLYANLAQTRSKGGKYAKSIYIAHKVHDEWVIGNIKASGSSLSAWIEFSKDHVTTIGKITMSKGVKQQAPTGDFYPPLFEWDHSEPEDDDTANALDKELQIYLNQYLAQPKSDEEDELTVESIKETATATPEQVADFEQRKRQASAQAKELADDAALQRSLSDDGDPGPIEPDTVIDNFDENEPINLDEIPF